jgi:hypothetical protein
MTMSKLVVSTLAALAAASIGLTAPAHGAPAGPSSVDGTIQQLQAEGFEVIVNRIGDAARDECTLRAVRPGQTYSRTDSGAPGAGTDLVTTVMSKTVYVDLQC